MPTAAPMHRIVSPLPKRDTRKGSTARGYDARWQKARLMFLEDHPLCVRCGLAANEVDHIVPHRGDYERFWNEDNWAAMCKRCHSSKTGRGE